MEEINGMWLCEAQIVRTSEDEPLLEITFRTQKDKALSQNSQALEHNSSLQTKDTS